MSEDRLRVKAEGWLEAQGDYHFGVTDPCTSCLEALTDLLRGVEAEERERCARLAEAPVSWLNGFVQERIAAKIRSTEEES